MEREMRRWHNLTEGQVGSKRETQYVIKPAVRQLGNAFEARDRGADDRSIAGGVYKRITGTVCASAGRKCGMQLSSHNEPHPEAFCWDAGEECNVRPIRPTGGLVCGFFGSIRTICWVPLNTVTGESVACYPARRLGDSHRCGSNSTDEMIRKHQRVLKRMALGLASTVRPHNGKAEMSSTADQSISGAVCATARRKCGVQLSARNDAEPTALCWDAGEECNIRPMRPTGGLLCRVGLGTASTICWLPLDAVTGMPIPCESSGQETYGCGSVMTDEIMKKYQQTLERVALGRAARRGEADQWGTSERPPPPPPQWLGQCSSIPCDWTLIWACPGRPRASMKGWAKNDGSRGFQCCCLFSSPPQPPPPHTNWQTKLVDKLADETDAWLTGASQTLTARYSSAVIRAIQINGTEVVGVLRTAKNSSSLMRADRGRQQRVQPAFERDQNGFRVKMLPPPQPLQLPLPPQPPPVTEEASNKSGDEADSHIRKELGKLIPAQEILMSKSAARDELENQADKRKVLCSITGRK